MSSRTHESLVKLMIALFIASMVYSKFLLSVSMFGLGLLVVFPFQPELGRSGFRRTIFKDIKTFFGHPAFFGLSLMVLAYVLSGINSEDLSEWFWRVRTKSPFLFVPMIFFLLDRWKHNFYRQVLFFFTGFMAFSCILVLHQYFSDPEAMVQLLRVGKAIPTPCHHVRYSLMLSLAAITACYFLISSVDKRYKVAMAAFFCLLVTALHILAVRTGLFSFYLGLIVLMIWHLIIHGRSWSGLVLLGGFLLLPFAAYRTSASFKQKMDYVRYDYEQLLKGNWQSHSDSERLVSITAGWHLFTHHPIVGVGLGDLRHEMDVIYQKEYGLSRSKFPHNQFLFVLAGSGMVGFVLFLTGLLMPLLLARPADRQLFVLFYLILLFSFLVENTIETAVGTAITVFWISFFLKQSKDAI